eukprot:TRINITY_DN49106_c0_g1_i1.p1 TRINITY_DN49106_c0_g1~~TRINITY_DN49106_c0_g1_i1.p1  ORF type:complete len:427 (-),score=58.84 TRINITY_DN49106_c0_g1_i1:42-1292(-)
MAAVILYSKAGCPFCADARACLTRARIVFEEVDVGDSDDIIRVSLATLCGEPLDMLTVPKVKIGDALIRSSTELQDLGATSALRELALRAGAPAAVLPRQPLPVEQGAVCLLHTGSPKSVWLDELRIRLASLNLPVCFVDVESMGPFDPVRPLPYSVVVNRVSDAAQPSLARYAASFLSVCKSQGISTVNGSAAYSIATSKIAQHGLFHSSGLRCPASFVVRCAEDVDEALPRLGEATILFKPNAGGFGKGIEKFEEAAALRRHAERPAAYGTDGIALLQRFHPVRQTHRVFVLADQVQCGVAVSIDEGQFGGQCMASAAKRRRQDGSSAVAAEDVSEAIRDGCIRALRSAGADVGSIEYLIEAETGEPLYYDLNLLSTFPDPKLVGKDCWLELAEFILKRSREGAEGATPARPSC